MRYLVCIPLLCTALLAQGPVPVYEVKRATSGVQVDGKLDEAAWKSAPPVDFVFPWESQTGAKQKTQARLTWDDRYLYVAYQCDDSEITTKHTKRDDPTYEDDAVEVFLNPKPSQNHYLGLEMNARGVLYDYFYVYPEFLLKRFDLSDVRVAAQPAGKGWTLEVAISWGDFEGLSNGKAPARGDVWTANLNRWDGSAPNRRLSQWSNSGLPKPSPHNPQRFGKLVFAD